MLYAGSGVITRAGQITLPKPVRKALSLRQGQYVEFFYDEDERVVVVSQKEAPIGLFERLAAKMRPEWERRGITRDDVLAEVKAVRAEITTANDITEK